MQAQLKRFDALFKSVEDVVLPAASKLPASLQPDEGMQVLTRGMYCRMHGSYSSQALIVVIGKYADKTSTWTRSDWRKTEWLEKGRDEPVMECFPDLSTATKRGVQKTDTPLSDDDATAARVIVEAFVEADFISFSKLKKGIIDNENKLLMDTPLGKKAALVVAVIAFYTSYNHLDPINREILGAARASRIGRTTLVERNIYVMDPSDPDSDISAAMWGVGKELGWDGEHMQKVVESIQTRSGRKVKEADLPQVEQDALRLVYKTFLVLSKERRAPIDARKLVSRIAAAVAKRNGDAARLRKSSGHRIPWTEAEHEALVQYLEETYAAGATWIRADAAMAVNWVGAFERTSEQMSNYRGAHLVSLCIELLSRDVSPTVFVSEDVLRKNGFFPDQSAKAGFRFDLPRLQRERAATGLPVFSANDRLEASLVPVKEE